MAHLPASERLLDVDINGKTPLALAGVPMAEAWKVHTNQMNSSAFPWVPRRPEHSPPKRGRANQCPKSLVKKQCLKTIDLSLYHFLAWSFFVSAFFAYYLCIYIYNHLKRTHQTSMDLRSLHSHRSSHLRGRRGEASHGWRRRQLCPLRRASVGERRFA